MTYFGFSGYGTSLADLQNLIPVMQAYHMNTIRISGTPPWLPTDAHSLDYAYVDYILANTSFNVIIDPNHLYGTTAGHTAADFQANIAVARAKLLEIAARYNNNPRVFIEIVNEYYDPTDAYPSGTKTYALIQGLINDVRAVCTNPIVWDKQPPPVPYQVLTGGNIAQGDHAYFGPGQYSAPSIFANMKAGAAALGLSFLCTEVGADWNEGPAFTATSVGTLNGFLSDCNDNGFGVCIWIRELTGPATNPDLIAYAKYGLVIPSNIINPIIYNVDIWAMAGGTTSPTGMQTVNSGTTITITAVPNTGYIFSGWLVNGVAHPATENPLTLAITAATTVIPQFQTIPLGAIEVHAYALGQEVNASVIVGTQTKTTPFSIEASPGSYTLTCTYQGNSLTQAVMVNGGQTTQVSFNFTPVATAGISSLTGILILAGIGFAALAYTSRKK